tara:strand:+ start:128800 stop:128982 length:183 start_codon:yes stop_codon:yes gene_type:complete
MGVRKNKLSKPSKSSKGLNHKVRFDFGRKRFIITNGKQKAFGTETFKNHDEALVYALSLE